MAGLAVALTPTDAQAQMEDTSSDAQMVEAKNSVFLELAGNGILYTVNYDRLFTPEFSGRIGIMRAGVSNVSLTAVPLTGSYLIGDGSHKFELGAGPELLVVSVDASGDFGGFDEDATTVAGTATIGYRYQPRDGGFRFNVGLTPTFSQFGFLPWAGLGVGYTF